MARVVDNRYAILEPLGRGGAGEVFLAQDEVLGRRVALKVLSRRYARDEEFVERFRREARSAAALNHPNVVAVHDLLEEVGEDGDLCIVMEYVRGLTLADLIEREGALSPRDATAIALHAARGLGAAHRHGVVHRDVKPANILLAQVHERDDGSDDSLADTVLSGRAVVKVTDFGVALDGSSARSLTEEGEIMGTVQYMSPEMVMGEKAGPQSDLYSLGVVLYEMLLGRRPFEAAEDEGPLAVAMRHVTETPVPPADENPEVPPDLSATITRLLCKDPADRQDSAAALTGELEKLLRDHPAQQEPEEVAPVPERSPAGKDGTARPETRRFRKEMERRRLIRRRRTILGASLVVLAVAFLAPAGLVGADRLSDGGVSRSLGVQVPFGSPADAGGRIAGREPTAESAAASTAREFVARVWGYAGDDEDEFWSRVEPLISPDFRDSPAWADVESGAELARVGGPAAMDSLVASEFLRFEVLEQGDGTVTGVAYFMNEKYPDGQRLDYRQEFRLVEQDGRWRLQGGERMEPVKGAPAGDEVVAAVEDYYEAVDREDWASAYANLDTRAQGLFTEDEWRRRSQWLADNGSSDMAEISVRATLVSGNLAAVKTDRTFADGNLVSRKSFFVHEGGAWKHRLSQEEVDIFMPGATYEEFVTFHAGSPGA